MPNVTLYHNPRCSKSRQALALLQEKKLAPQVVEYLKTPLAKAQLKTLLKQLNLKAHDIIRTKESVYQSLGLSKHKEDEDKLIDAIATHPILMERPIVVKNKKAIVARPPEKIKELL